MKRSLSIALVAAALVQAGGIRISAQLPPPIPDGPLTHFDTAFVTGDVAIGGTSLFRKGVNGFATQNINMGSGVPPGAEILSAYLYIQTTFRDGPLGEAAGLAGASFNGFPLNTTLAAPSFNGPIAKALNWAPGNNAGTQACWSYGWNPRRKLVTYRADVLRFLDINPVGHPHAGKHRANGAYQVKVADAGKVNILNDDAEDLPSMTAPRAVGASLVLIYRHPDPTWPLRAIVIYDGGVTKRSNETMTQRIQGVYDPTGNARMTHIVGDGQLLFPERTQFGSLVYLPNQFTGLSSGTFPRWDNRTFALPAGALKPYPYASPLNTVTVGPQGPLTDCLSWSAIVVSSEVRDTDKDGIQDLVESWNPPDGLPILDPNGQPLPLLSAMCGDPAVMCADPAVKDIFVEIGYLTTVGEVPNVTYGGIAKPPHSHLPAFDALKQVAKAFELAPERINVHFDVGANYQDDPSDLEIEVPSFIVPASRALGGKSFSETACVNALGNPIVCQPEATGQYPLYPGTVGWKTGYRFYRDDVLKFSPGRMNIFRYALFAHALGIPKEENEFLPNTSTPNPAFHIPRTNSGVADWAGADALITLGAFDDADGLPIGTPFMQASTLMHEWGHNFGRRHGGDLGQVNCKPQYFSVLNYLYQMRGLLDADGVPQLDYHRGNPVNSDPVVELNEADLFDGAVNQRYRMGWYAPKETSYLKNLGLNVPGQPDNPLLGTATKHCDGSEFPGPPAQNPMMVRLDATGLTNPIDWKADTLPGSGFPQDINFDGELTPLEKGSDDWGKLRLNQLGSRRSIGGVFLDKNSPNLAKPIVGPLSLNAGKGDLGKGDLGKGDLGKGDLGTGILGKGDLGKGDLGKGDLGKGDLGSGIDGASGAPLTLGKGDLGKGDLGEGDTDVGSGARDATGKVITVHDMDYPTATAPTGEDTPAPASGLQACLTNGEGQCAGEGGGRPVRLSWLKPNNGVVARYLVYRFVSNPLVPFEPPAEIVASDLIADDVEGTSYVDYGAPAGVRVAYVVVAQRVDGKTAGISNFDSVITPPQAVLAWAPTTSCVAGETPIVSIVGNTVTMGVPSGDTTMNSCIHGGSAVLPPLTGGNSQYKITFAYNLFTWDAYNPPGEGTTGYWDSFSVTTSNSPYQNLGLSDPITLPGFVWGGTSYGDGILECNPGSCSSETPGLATVFVPGNTDGGTYLNVILDTLTQPFSNHSHPSYGTITILDVVQVPGGGSEF